MHFLMPSDPTNRGKVDSHFTEEYKVAVRYGSVHLTDGISVQMPVHHGRPVDLMYMGWMMTPLQYMDIHALVESRGYELVNTPKQYFNCHYLDNWYPIISDLTPQSLIIEIQEELRPMLDRVLAFRSKAGCSLIVKDSVKSLKHQWQEACYINYEASPVQVARTLATFFESKKRYNDLQGSLVVREYIPLEYVGAHKISGMPVSYELRGWVVKGKLIYASPYWDDKVYKYKKVDFPLKTFEEVADRIYKKTGNKFFTIDLAMLPDGNWICIEVGDGQVSSLPESADINTFFAELMGGWKSI